MTATERFNRNILFNLYKKDDILQKTSNGEILEEKKKTFLHFINLALLIYKLKDTPAVIFREGYLSDGNAVKAHIHLDTKTICVSLMHLNKMTDEEIKETAFHEINHIFIVDHSTSFYNNLSDAMTISWRFERKSGIISIDGNKALKKPEGQKSIHLAENNCCNHHLCREKVEVIRCTFCGRYFCIKHIKPVPSGLPSFNELNDFSTWKRQDACHACPEYSEYLHDLCARA
jgi:hypothetical protein